MISLNKESIKYCIGAFPPFLIDRAYDGTTVYSSPTFCKYSIQEKLHIVHHDLHTLSSTVVDDEHAGLSKAITGLTNGFIIQARDKFGNIRSGSKTKNVKNLGDGSSDSFLVRINGPGGYSIVTSSSVQTIKCSDSSINGYFRLSYADAISMELQHDISASAMQVALITTHTPNANVEVTRKVVNGNFQWNVTFLSHLLEWSLKPLSVISGHDRDNSISSLMEVGKVANNGLYPIQYTLWVKGIYELTIVTDGSSVSGSSYSFDVSDGVVHALTSLAYGNGLISGIAGKQLSFFIQANDQHQPEVQAIYASAQIIDFIHEIQRIEVLTPVGECFSLSFRGKTTEALQVGSSMLVDVKRIVEDLPTITSVTVTTTGSDKVEVGDFISVPFLTEYGSLGLMQSTRSEVISKIVEGETPYRKERQVFLCDAQGGSVKLSYKLRRVILEYDDSVVLIEKKISIFVESSVSCY